MPRKEDDTITSTHAVLTVQHCTRLWPPNSRMNLCLKQHRVNKHEDRGLSPSVFSYPKGHADNRPPRREGFILTSIEAAGSRRPAHDRGNGTDDSPHPRVGNAHSLHGGVTARVQEYVEGSQGPGEGVHPQRQQGDSWHSAGGSEADGEQGAVERAGDTH